jgi:hypothetical protein
MDRINHTILLIEDDSDYARLVPSWISAGSSETAVVLAEVPVRPLQVPTAGAPLPSIVLSSTG